MAQQQVYMRFEKFLGRWRVSFVAPADLGPLKDFTFAHPEKIEILALRAGALKDLASKQALDMGLRSGTGGMYLNLTEAQLASLRPVASQSGSPRRRP